MASLGREFEEGAAIAGPPFLQHGLLEVIEIREVEIEAAARDAELLGEQVDLDGGYAATLQNLERGGDPALPAQRPALGLFTRLWPRIRRRVSHGYCVPRCRPAPAGERRGAHCIMMHHIAVANSGSRRMRAG